MSDVARELCLNKQRDYQLRLLVLALHPDMDMPLLCAMYARSTYSVRYLIVNLIL